MNGSSSLYIHHGAVSRAGNMVKVWAMLDYKKAETNKLGKTSKFGKDVSRNRLCSKVAGQLNTPPILGIWEVVIKLSSWLQQNGRLIRRRIMAFFLVFTMQLILNELI